MTQSNLPEQVKVPEEFTPEQVRELEGSLPQILNERKVMMAEYDSIVILDVTSKDTQKRAGELRKLILKNRTQGIEKWHSTTKNYFLRGGQFVDAVKRKEIEVNKRMEDTLSAIENYEENEKKKRLAELKQKRLEDLGSLAVFLPQGVYVEDLDENGFLHIKKMCAELQAEEVEKIKRVEEERLRAESERAELIRLRKLQEQKEKEEQARKKSEEALMKKPEGVQIKAWIQSMSIPNAPIVNETTNDIKAKFEAFKLWAMKQVNQ